MRSRRGVKEAVKAATKDMFAAQSPSPQFSAGIQRPTAAALHGGQASILDGKKAFCCVATFESRTPGVFARGRASQWDRTSTPCEFPGLL